MGAGRKAQIPPVGAHLRVSAHPRPRVEPGQNPKWGESTEYLPPPQCAATPASAARPGRGPGAGTHCPPTPRGPWGTRRCVSPSPASPSAPPGDPYRPSWGAQPAPPRSTTKQRSPSSRKGGTPEEIRVSSRGLCAPRMDKLQLRFVLFAWVFFFQATGSVKRKDKYCPGLQPCAAGEPRRHSQIRGYFQSKQRRGASCAQAAAGLTFGVGGGKGGEAARGCPPRSNPPSPEQTCGPGAAVGPDGCAAGPRRAAHVAPPPPSLGRRALPTPRPSISLTGRGTKLPTGG